MRRGILLDDELKVRSGLASAGFQAFSHSLMREQSFCNEARHSRGFGIRLNRRDAYGGHRRPSATRATRRRLARWRSHPNSKRCRRGERPREPSAARGRGSSVASPHHVSGSRGLLQEDHNQRRVRGSHWAVCRRGWSCSATSSVTFHAGSASSRSASTWGMMRSSWRWT